MSCFRCHKTIKGAEAYSLWAHVESKRCYPDNAIKGWKQQAKEKEQKAQIEEAHRATAKEAARKMQKARDKGQGPQNYPAHPPPLKPAAIVHLRGDERLEEITTFETRRPKEVKPRVVKVSDDRARREEEPKRRSASAPPLDDEAGVGDVGESPILVMQIWLSKFLSLRLAKMAEQFLLRLLKSRHQ